MLRADDTTLAQNRCALERVAQLADFARPVVPDQRLFRIPRQAGRWTPERFADLLQERLAQRESVGFAFAKRCNADVKDLEGCKYQHASFRRRRPVVVNKVSARSGARAERYSRATGWALTTLPLSLAGDRGWLALPRRAPVTAMIGSLGVPEFGCNPARSWADCWTAVESTA